MARVQWTPDLELGIIPIDMQHKRIVELINRLDAARIQGDRQKVEEIIDGLIEYTLSHFAFEESLMEEAGYRFLDLHRKVHELFTRKIHAIHARYRQGEDVSAELATLLERWLLGHIRKDDLSYANAVRENILRLTADRREGGWLSRALGRFFRQAN